MHGALSAPPDSIHPDQEITNDLEINGEPPLNQRIHSKGELHAKTRRSSKHWATGELQESGFDGKTRATRKSIAYIPTPRASRGFHEHNGRRVFDEDFLEQLRMHKQRSKLGKTVRRFSLHSILDSFRGPSTAAPPVRFSFSRTMKQQRRHLRWRISNLTRPISPEGTLNHFRELMLFIVLGFQLFYIPFAPVYLNDGAGCKQAQKNINIAMELVLVGNTILNFNTATYDTKRLSLIENRKDIARKYVSGSFVPDLLGSLPLEFFTWLSCADGDIRTLAGVHPNAYIVENLFRFLWIRHFRRLEGSSWIRAIQEGIRKICQASCGVHISVLAVSAKLFVTLVTAAHYLTCGLRCILKYSRTEFSSEAPVELYTRDLLQVASTLFGNGRETGNPKADAYSAFLVLVGAVSTAYTTSRVAMEMLLGASSTKSQASTPSSDPATPPRKRNHFEPVGTSVLQHESRPRKLSKRAGMRAEPISFNTQRSTYYESAAGTVESSFSKWSEAPPEPASPSVNNTSEPFTTSPKQIATNNSPSAAETEILQLLKSFAKTVQRVETKLDKLSLNQNNKVAGSAATTPKLHRSKSVQGDSSMLLSRNPAVYSRSFRYQNQERNVPT
ncbi:hypothetical protein ON010_g1217 [Phytophthora cinnamomi]|nr:hypothetical protein ON010_g1217 [Phytophthora cinnamomi]